MSTMDRKAQFLKVYANLPDATRDEIVAVIGGAPYTWNSARIEIDQDAVTPLGEKVLDVLVQLGILKP